MVATGGEEMVCVVRRAGEGQPGGEANEIPGERSLKEEPGGQREDGGKITGRVTQG